MGDEVFAIPEGVHRFTQPSCWSVGNLGRRRKRFSVTQTAWQAALDKPYVEFYLPDLGLVYRTSREAAMKYGRDCKKSFCVPVDCCGMFSSCGLLIRKALRH